MDFEVYKCFGFTGCRIGPDHDSQATKWLSPVFKVDASAISVSRASAQSLGRTKLSNHARAMSYLLLWFEAEAQKGRSIPAGFVFPSITKTAILSFSPCGVACSRRGQGIRGIALNPLPL